MAEYYVKNKYYGASRIYYQNVINNWPDTQLAQKSKARIDEFKDKPAAPTPPFDWLVKLLPAEKHRQPGLSAWRPAACPLAWDRRRPAWERWVAWAPATCRACTSGTTTR